MIPVVEIFGLPGSGKTHFARKFKEFCAPQESLRFIFREELSLRGLKTRNDGFLTNLLKRLPAPLWHPLLHEDYCLQELLSFASQNVEICRFVFSVLDQADISTPKSRSILGAIARTSIEYKLIAGQQNKVGEVLLADEWFCHRLYTLFGNCALTPTRQQLQDYLRYIPSSCATVFIATPPEECIERMIKRNRFPVLLAELTSGERVRLLRSSHNFLHSFSEMLMDQGRNTIIYDGSTDSFLQTAERCLHSLYISKKE